MNRLEERIYLGVGDREEARRIAEYARDIAPFLGQSPERVADSVLSLLNTKRSQVYVERRENDPTSPIME